MSKRLKIAVYLLYAILIFLAVIWIFGVMRNWEAMQEKPVRVAYFLCDYTIVIPLGFIAGFGLKAGKRWAHYLFVFVLGALLFDTAHQVYYLFWDNYFGVPLVFAAVLLLAVVVYTVFAFKAAEVKKLIDINLRGEEDAR
jgi:hypothetical protein